MKIFLLLNMTKGHRYRWPLFTKKAPRTGFEPVTYRLTAGRSTVELSRKMFSWNARSIHEVMGLRQYFLVRTGKFYRVSSPSLAYNDNLSISAIGPHQAMGIGKLFKGGDLHEI